MAFNITSNKKKTLIVECPKWLENTPGTVNSLFHNYNIYIVECLI